MLKKVFPLSFMSKDLLSLLFACTTYLLIGVLASWLFISLLGVPFVGWIINAYVAAGIIMAILKRFGKI
jgi:hypothetical protein